MEIKTAVAALSALAQETRLAAYRLLVQAGPEGLAAGRVAEALAIAPATLSFHLKEMSFAGLVSARSDGRYVLYTANFGQMTALLAYLTENCCGGQPVVGCPAAASAVEVAPRAQASPAGRIQSLLNPTTGEH